MQQALERQIVFEDHKEAYALLGDRDEFLQVLRENFDCQFISRGEQLEILGRLETLLALVEGWVDEVVAQASARWMPSSSQLAEAVRRRRAAGGPAEEVFKTLVGLEIRPRRVRDAANLWAALTADRGVGGRDAVWNHPDLIPTAADLDDPLGYVAGERQEAPLVDDLDAELARLLSEEDERRSDEG